MHDDRNRESPDGRLVIDTGSSVATLVAIARRTDVQLDARVQFARCSHSTAVVSLVDYGFIDDDRTSSGSSIGNTDRFNGAPYCPAGYGAVY